MKLTRLSFNIAAAVFFPLAAFGALKAGFAERDITPDVGMEVPGGYHKVFSKKIHDPCKARIAVFDDGSHRVALVGLDALIVPRSLVLEVRRLIQEKCGIAPASVVIGASHSHSSGPVGMVQPHEYDHASEFVRNLAYNKSSCADPKYLAKVRDAIVDGVVEADKARALSAAGFGTGSEPTVAFNRRIRMKNGRTVTHPGRGNPDNVEYANPVDPQVGVVGVWDHDGKIKGCIVNFSCHATTSGPGISANWIYNMERVIQGYYGKDCVVVFLQGACGDVAQVDNLSPQEQRDGESSSQFVGGRVGAEAVKVLVAMSQARVTDVPLDVRQKTWSIQRRVPDPARVKAARELAAKDSKTAGPDWVWAKETVMLDALIAKSPTVEVEVQAIQIGPVVCISNPAEYFVSFGLDLKKRSGFPITFPVELANGCVGYVPDDEAFGPHGGGYETRLTSYSNLDITAGNQFRDTGLQLAHQLKPSKLPEAPPAPVWKQTWPYGNQPPQLK